MENKLISIIIPVFKSSESLKALKNDIHELFRSLNYEYEIIFVNDSPLEMSTNLALEEVRQSDSDGFVKILQMNQNRGQQYATLCGISRAKGDYIITMDDDLQHPVKEIPKLITAMEKGDTDLIFAIQKYKDKKHNLFRNMGSWLVNKIDNTLIPTRNNIRVSAFRIFKGRIVPYILSSYSSYPAISNLLIKLSANVKNIEVDHRDREFGTSNYAFKDLIILAWSNLLNYTSLPLAILGFTGIIAFIGSLLFISVIFIQKIFYSISIPGYASTVILISFFGGLNLLGIGIIGEYLIRIIREQNKPQVETLFTEKQQ